MNREEQTDDLNLDDFGKERQRVKVRKRIRVRKKKSSKRKIKKIFEYLLWFIVIAGFITTLVIMIKELEISDEKYKKKKKSDSSFNLMIPRNDYDHALSDQNRNKLPCVVFT